MNQIELNKTISYILDNIDDSRRVLNSVVSIRKKLIDLTIRRVISEQDFYKISSVLSSQSRSPMWENYFIKKHDCEKVKISENRGDFKKNDIYKAARAHGTQVLVNNENIEYRMTLHKDSADWDRWINNYHKEGDIFQS